MILKAKLQVKPMLNALLTKYRVDIEIYETLKGMDNITST